MIGIVLTIAVSVLFACYKNNNEKPETWDVDQEEAEITEAEATEPKTAEVKAYRVPGIDPGGEEKTEQAPVQKPVKEKITPVLSEEEILNMSDDEFMNYGQLVFDGLLNEAYPQINKMKDFTELINPDDIYTIYVFRAEKSADNDLEANIIAEEFWESKNEFWGSVNGSEGKKYFNRGITGENSKFWVFKGDLYLNNDYSYSERLVVFKSEYYDMESRKTGFELNDENVKLFFDLVYEEQYSNMRVCIGEYVSEVEGGVEFRKYYIDVHYYMDLDKWDNTLLKKTWHISDDGIVNKPDPESEVVREWNSHEWLLWQIYGDDWKL